MAREREAETLVIDLMANDPIVVAAELPVAKVAEVLTDYDIGGLPVVDSAGRLIGVVSQTDLLGYWASVGSTSGSDAVKARDVMTEPAVTIRGRNASTPWIGPHRSTSMIHRQSSWDISAIGPPTATPALPKTMSARPNQS